MPWSGRSVSTVSSLRLALAGLLLAGEQPAALLLAVASIGNVAGSTVNWALGRGVAHWPDRRWFPVRPDALTRAEAWYRRWGRWSLLLSWVPVTWVPVIGDPLTVAAGVLREPLWIFLALVTVAKVTRYLIVAWAALSMG
jgi:membrane protein YqaA with SNARE-associated domain